MSHKEPFLVTSAPTTIYNCIAWAYGTDQKWMWPANIDFFWPEGIPNECNIPAFIALFESIGYSVCESNDSLEEGFEKVLLYCDNNGVPQHAARQLLDGQWTSKLGPYHDVTHSIFSMSNGVYGNVFVYMKRRRK